jgi:hypothetical protein
VIAKECENRPDYGDCQTEGDGAAYGLTLFEGVPEVDVI